jgi:hypothetical protein
MPSGPRAASRPPQPLPWPFPPGFLPFWYATIVWWWWREIHQQLASLPAAIPSLGNAGMVWLALGTRLLSTLSEAGAYVLWWKGRGARLPYWRFFCWVASLSSADLLGFALRRAIGESSQGIGLLGAALAGPSALEPRGPADSGLAVAFGNLGVLTLLRVGMTGWAQARGTGRPLRGPIAVTVVAWLVTRLVGWWSFDLARGLSPVR